MRLLALFLLGMFSTVSLQAFTSMPAEQLRKEQKNITIIDIRTVGEWKETGIIEGSHLITFFNRLGKYDIDKWMSEFEKVVPNANEPFVLVCAHASRTKLVANFLESKLGYKKVYDLKDGIEKGWIQTSKFPTVKH